MKPIVPSRSQLEVLRGIAGAGFEYAATKRLCAEAGWQLVEDEPDLGFIQRFLWVGPSDVDRRLLSVGTPETEGSPHIYLPLFYFPEEQGGDPSEYDRAPFDEAYRGLSDGVSMILGASRRDGIYEHAHRAGWQYSFRTWRVPEAQVILLQDEYDIQFGMDVSLWLFPTEPEILVPLPY
jgi:hypothetical protein